MKKTLLALTAVLGMKYSQAQNSLPANGNVGINTGTTSPAAPFVVVGKAVFGSNVIGNDPTDAIYLEKQGYVQMHLFQPQAQVHGYFSLNNDGNSSMTVGSSTPGMQIWTATNHRLSFGTNANERMTILGNGNIGIGNNNPLTKLNINAGENNKAIEINGANYYGDNNTHFFPAISFYTTNNGVRTPSATAEIALSDRPGTYGYAANIRASDMLFYTSHSYNPATNNYGTFPDLSMVIQSNQDGGYVGIGSSNPLNPLTVKGSGPWGTVRILPKSEGSEASLSFSSHPAETDYSNVWVMGTDAFSNFQNFTIGTSAPYGPIMTMLTSGNVGIGASTPISNLQVDDGCTMASVGDASGQSLNFGTSYMGFNAARNVVNKTWTQHSDGVNNGGGVIYSDIFGNIYFSAVKSTGAGDKVLSDDQIRSNISFRIGWDGSTHAKQIYVETTGWPDYVFKRNYRLNSLKEVASYIAQNNHLPDMPSEKEVAKDGINIGEMNKLLLKKVEELTLYLIEKDKKDNDQQQQIDKLQEQVKALLSRSTEQNKRPSTN